MGRPKALLAGEGDCLLAEALAAVAACGDGIVILSLPLAGAVTVPTRVRAVINPNSDSGQLRSLQLGLEVALAEGRSGVFVCLVDNPGQLAERLEFLAAQVATEPCQIRCVGHGGQPGHPVWIPAAHFPGLLKWDGPEGARGYFASVPDAPRCEDFPDASPLTDLDFPSDYEAFRAGLRAKK